jgi:uncharacterized OsmC-like protein
MQCVASIDVGALRLEKAGRRTPLSKQSNTDSAKMLEYRVEARRIDAQGSVARTKEAEIVLDTCLVGRVDAFNPAELLLAAVAACMIKGIERVAPMLKFDLRGVEIRLHGIRQDSPPKIVSIEYAITIDTHETDQRLELLHKNVRKYGTIFNTVAAATKLEGTVGRKG